MKQKKHQWNYENIGGSTRVKITTGADIAHLDQLDPKMWTVLSCPATGLEIDEKSLTYMDCDSDGKIRINDVVCTYPILFSNYIQIFIPFCYMNPFGTLSSL